MSGTPSSTPPSFSSASNSVLTRASRQRHGPALRTQKGYGLRVPSHADGPPGRRPVIGAGPGGYPAAIRAAQLGKRVLLVERDRLGGECLNYGCIPSKALIHTGNLVRAIERAGERGVETGPVKVDLARLQQWKTSVVQRLVTGIGQLC